jgi:hypothetical protein
MAIITADVALPSAAISGNPKLCRKITYCVLARLEAQHGMTLCGPFKKQ